MEINNDFVNKILELAKNGVTKSRLIAIAFSYGLKQKDVGKHIAEAKKRGMYSVPMGLFGDTYYQYDEVQGKQ